MNTGCGMWNDERYGRRLSLVRGHASPLHLCHRHNEGTAKRAEPVRAEQTREIATYPTRLCALATHPINHDPQDEAEQGDAEQCRNHRVGKVRELKDDLEDDHHAGDVDPPGDDSRAFSHVRALPAQLSLVTRVPR